MEDFESDLNDDSKITRPMNILSDAESSDDDRRVKRIKLAKNNTSKKPWQEAFMCMEKNDGASNDKNPNSLTIAKLQELANYYERVKDSWRTLAYRKAIGALRQQKRRYSSRKMHSR